jgi:3-oxoacyl-[acyl-carrier-protein] synthase-3
MAGTGSFLPAKKLTNLDLEKVMETTDEWIVQRTGIRERRMIGPGESVSTLATEALRKALAAARLQAKDLDLIICSTMTAEMPCPPTACLVSNALGGGGHAGAFDVNGACCGFVFGLNMAHDLIKGGAYRTIGLVGSDTLSVHMNYSTAGRGTAIIFGDGAGAVVLKATDDTSLGLLAQCMHAEGKGWKDIYIPQHDRDFPAGVTPDPEAINRVQMNGAGVFKFAVGTFPNLIQETLDKARVTPDQVDMYICHQSNARILQSARERFGIPEEKLYVNIDRVGNTVAASVPLCLDELISQGRVKPGMKVMFVAFGGGLTWGSSLWQL